MATVTLTGGAFQDPSGNVAAGYTLTLQLNKDGQISNLESPPGYTGQVCAGQVVGVTLDADGNVPASPAFSVISTDSVITGDGNPAQYCLKVYDLSGRLIFGPEWGAIPYGSGTFDLGNF
jgi:hypothetical protein